MGGFCGWHVSSFEPTQAETALADMLACYGGSNSVDKRCVIHGSAVAARPGMVPIDIHHAGSLVVAAEGRLQWGASGLAAQAAQHGAAAAVAEAYRRYGDECLRHIAGSFAIAVMD